MSDQKDTVENPVDNSELDTAEQAVEAPEQAEEAASGAVETVENDSPADAEDVSSQPVEIINEGGESVHTELKATEAVSEPVEAEVVEAKVETPEVIEAEAVEATETAYSAEDEAPQHAAEADETPAESAQDVPEEEVAVVAGVVPGDTEMTETSTISAIEPRVKFMTAERLKKWLKILSLVFLAAGVVAMIYGIVLGVGAKNEPVENTRAQNEQVAEKLQSIVSSGELDKCDELTDSVEGEPAGQWCKVGDFRAFIEK